PSVVSPPSSLMGLSGLNTGMPTGVQNAPAAADGHAFQLTASVQSMEGTRSLCTVTVPYRAGETEEQGLTRARDAVNARPMCVERGVQAQLEGVVRGTSEDEFPRAPQLRLEAPDITGGQLITTLGATPGRTTGTCFQVTGLGIPVLNQLRIMMLTFATAPTG